MADDKTFTKAELDAAIATAVGKVQESVDKLETKNDELVAEVRTAKAAARKAGEITPDTHQAEVDRADRAEAALAEANKSVKTLTIERDKAVKSLETEQGAARTYALEAEIASAIASGNVVPALVPAFKAMVTQQAKADLVDGKYAVTIGDKSAKEYIDGFLAGEDGKAFRSAALNSGSDARGGTKGTEAGKTMLRSAFDALPEADKGAFVREGGRPVDVAA